MLQSKVFKVLSGVQPSGVPTLGTYFGALTQFQSFQRYGTEEKPAMFMIADLHALSMPSTLPPPEEFKNNILLTTASFIAAGVDVDSDSSTAFIFKQSDVRAHCEMKWMLECITPVGELSRMTQFKSKSSDDSRMVGLLTYPVLMAADILLYKTEAVPVGLDQRQHIELIVSIAAKFNNQVNERVFPLPKLLLPKGRQIPKVMCLNKPRTKMSKSSGNKKGTIMLTDSAEEIAQKIKEALTDSYPCIDETVETDEERCGVLNLVKLYSVSAYHKKKDLSETIQELKGMQMSQFKPLLIEALVEHLRPVKNKIEDLMDNEAYLKSVIEKGNVQANMEADRTLNQCKSLLGV